MKTENMRRMDERKSGGIVRQNREKKRKKRLIDIRKEGREKDGEE